MDAQRITEPDGPDLATIARANVVIDVYMDREAPQAVLENVQEQLVELTRAVNAIIKGLSN